MVIDRKDITAVILAGGRASRLKGQDKGLLWLNRRPLVEQVITAISTQVNTVLISANRNLEEYRHFAPVVSDDWDDFQGPLAGFAAALRLADTKYLLVLPCDSPLISADLVFKLKAALIAQNADISVAYDGQDIQPVFSLLKTSLLPDLLTYLTSGGRTVRQWYGQQQLAPADLSANKNFFCNLNTPRDFAALTSTSTPPVLGFVAFSGTGKTQLLRQVIKNLKSRGLNIALIKHAHHDFDIDHKGKDSYELRKAGASQVLVASDKRSALIKEYNTSPSLENLISQIDTTQLDLIIVEGFKSAKINKIELQRAGQRLQDFYKSDENIIAVASDDLEKTPVNRVLLNLNDIEEITQFVLAYINKLKK